MSENLDLTPQLRLIIGDLIIQIAQLRTENEALRITINTNNTTTKTDIETTKK